LTKNDLKFQILSIMLYSDFELSE